MSDEKQSSSFVCDKLFEFVKNGATNEFKKELARIKHKTSSGGETKLEDILNKAVVEEEKDEFPLLVYAARKNHIEIVKILLENKVDVNCVSSKNVSALIEACMNNNLVMSQLLMENGANPNYIFEGKKGKSHIMVHVAFTGNLQLMKLIINLDQKYKYSFDWVCVCTA